MNIYAFLLPFLTVFVLVERVHLQVINVNGDLTIVGLFQVHKPEGDSCGLGLSAASVMTSEAVKWYIEGLNQYGKLPFKIGFEGHETCGLVSKASEISIKLMNKALTNKTILGVIGPEFSSEAEAISPILSSVTKESRLVQVGFSTTAARLGDTEKYPNFVRVVPNDDVQVEVMIKTMKSLEWNRIAIIYVNDTYGRDASNRLILRANEESICTSMNSAIPVETSGDFFNSLISDITIGTGNRASINGIVYIGPSSFARSIFIALENTGFTSHPIVMLSEGINMETSVFQYNSGSTLKSSKGSLVLAPNYQESIEFTSHWRSIFTNKTYFEKEVMTNPWLMEVYYEITECERRNCDFTPLTESDYNQVFEAQILYVQYAILAAHALVKGTRELHNKYCPSSVFCDGFKTNFRSGDLVNVLENINIDLGKDFQWKLPSLSDRKLQLNSTETQQKDLSLYDVFNFRKNDELSTEFDLIKVSDRLDNDITINKEKLRDYTINNEELVWPNVRKAQCMVDTKCKECINIEELRESIIFEQGDIYVVGVIAVFDSDSTSGDGCGKIRIVSGYQTAESIRFAVKKVNAKTGDFSGFFPGLQIGLIVLNSCNDPVIIQRKIYKLIHNGVQKADGSVIDLHNRILGFIGDIGSSISIAVAELLSRLHFVQLSFASTSPVLSDRSKYPYFMRVVTPDDAQARAIIKIIQELESNYVQIVYSTGAYGEAGKDKIKEEAVKSKICVVQEIAVDETDSGFGIFEKLRLYTHARIVIIFLRSHRIVPVMSALTSQINTRGEFMFIGSEAWARKRDPLKTDSKQNLLGSFTLSLEMYEDNELRTHIYNLTPKPFNQNPWSTLYLQEKRNCYFDLSFDKIKNKMCSLNDDNIFGSDFTLDSWATAAYVATKSLLIGGNNFLRDKCGISTKVLCGEFTDNTKGFVEAIKDTKLDLDGSGNKIKVFSDNGNGNIGYRIYNIQKDDDPQILTYTEVGRFPLEGTFTFEKNLIVNPSGNPIESTCPSEPACSECLQSDKSPEKDTEKESLNVGMIVLGVFLAIALIAVLILVICLMKLRETRKRASEIYLTPTTPNVEHKLQREEAIGSEEFATIPACSPNPSRTAPPDIQTTDT
ncbi:uncharacterized protein LOC132757490 isoform X2 [Ruditapes philippinarum]|uniref:uncharacterized protein LOC132757490 isoform X1 n=1 Tax=Ruditapes philippinarum TaxID=129788 RepID=UPI00295AD52C|nr:uncharacterized protein LOC132757490 isoform X1 [Ruditapes philippinarum]XP_060604761.1 uncharacterized protein LOC132757490 isoform X2 [Ruditapes philippinarum]